MSSTNSCGNEVTPSRLEKYMTSFLNQNLVFIDSMQFLNSSLKKPVKNLSGNDFKYFIKEFVKNNVKNDWCEDRKNIKY